jgi:hypothetical protein
LPPSTSSSPATSSTSASRGVGSLAAGSQHWCTQVAHAQGNTAGEHWRAGGGGGARSTYNTRHPTPKPPLIHGSPPLSRSAPAPLREMVRWPEKRRMSLAKPR